MFPLMTAFTVFHLLAGTASLALGVRFLTPEEQAHWRSRRALWVAAVMCWVYPAAAFAGASLAWRAYNAGGHHAFPLMLAPILWLLVMGLIFAIVDFAEDGVLGNARSRD